MVRYNLELFHGHCCHSTIMVVFLCGDERIFYFCLASLSLLLLPLTFLLSLSLLNFRWLSFVNLVVVVGAGVGFFLVIGNCCCPCYLR